MVAVTVTATTSSLLISSPRHGFVSTKLRQNVSKINTKCASSSSFWCLKFKAINDPTKASNTRIGVTDWSALLAAITTIFLQHEMMFHSKKKRLDDVHLRRMVRDGFVFRQNFNIRSYETGPDGKVRIETVLNYMQETVLNHGKTTGLLDNGLGSTPEMCKRNLIWVVTKMQVVVDRYPTCGDVIQIETWRVLCGKNSARSDWLFRDRRTGEILVRASSKWAMMNKETRRLSKFPNEVRAELEQYFVDRPPIMEETTKNYTHLDTNIAYVHNGLMARWKDLDMNQHVNNVKYVRWILESVPKHIDENYELSSMTLEYRRECRKDNVLQSQTCVLGNNNGDYHVDCQHLLQLEGDCSGEIMKGSTRWRPKCANEVDNP